jgi:hypothetical protein
MKPFLCGTRVKIIFPDGLFSVNSTAWGEMIPVVLQETVFEDPLIIDVSILNDRAGNPLSSLYGKTKTARKVVVMQIQSIAVDTHACIESLLP